MYVAIVFSIAAAMHDGQHGSEAILASESYYLREAEIATLSNEALAGSPGAATKLANFYWLSGKPDVAKAKYWAIVGAENGSVECKFMAWQALSRSRDTAEQHRSIFWLKAAADEDYLGSKATLARCGSWPDPPGVDEDAACFGPAKGR